MSNETELEKKRHRQRNHRMIRYFAVSHRILAEIIGDSASDGDCRALVSAIQRPFDGMYPLVNEVAERVNFVPNDGYVYGSGRWQKCVQCGRQYRATMGFYFGVCWICSKEEAQQMKRLIAAIRQDERSCA